MNEHKHEWVSNDDTGTGMEYCKKCRRYKLAYQNEQYKQALEDAPDIANCNTPGYVNWYKNTRKKALEELDE